MLLQRRERKLEELSCLLLPVRFSSVSFWSNWKFVTRVKEVRGERVDGRRFAKRRHAGSSNGKTFKTEESETEREPVVRMIRKPAGYWNWRVVYFLWAWNITEVIVLSVVGGKSPKKGSGWKLFKRTHRNSCFNLRLILKVKAVFKGEFPR